MDTRQVIEEAYAAYERGDLSGALSFCAKDVCFAWNATEGLAPFADECHSRDEFQAALERLLAGWDIRDFKCIDLITEGERAASRVRITVVNRETGRQVHSQLGHFWTVRDGKIRDLREFYDTSAVVAAMSAET